MDDSIRHRHDQCFRGFDSLCRVLTRETQYHQELLPEVVSDLFGRFNVWAGNIGAGQQGQASLDFRLREASSVKEHVVGILRSLLESLEDATSIVSGSRLPYDQLSSDSDSSTSSLSNTSIQDDPDLKLSAEDCARTELQQLQHSIATSVSNLYKISIIIRQSPFPHDRTTIASKIDTSFYEFFDQRHVREKYPAVNAALAKRLGNANSRRRKYFKYREQHRQRLSRQDATKLSAPTETSGQDSQIETNQNVLPSGQQTAPSVVQTVSVVQPAATVQSTGASTFHARDVSAVDVHILDLHSVAGTNTTSGSVSSMRQERLAIPPTPESAQGGREFECPYCYTICCLKSSDNYNQNREWKRHVLRDLQPYICTFGGCSQGDRMFERRRDWFGHELQVHRVEWCCNTPGHQAYSTRSEFRIHLKRHGESYDDDQLDSMIDMFKRPAVESSFSCPICWDDRYQNLSIDRLEEHLGRHLEIICTFALPSAGDAECSSDSIVTQGAVQNDQIITATTTSVHSDGMMNDRDDGSKIHVHPYQDRLERFEGVQEPQQQYIRDVLQFVEETEHGPQNLQFFIAELAELVETLPDPELQAIPTNAEEVIWRTLSRIRNASEEKSVNECYGLPQFVEHARDVIVDEMLIFEDDDRFHALMRKSLAVLTSVIWDYWFPIYGSHKLVMQEPLERLKSKLEDPLPSELVDESDQNLGQSEDSVPEFHGDWNFLQTGTDRRQRMPWVQTLESTAQQSESGSPVGNRSDNGDGSVGRGRTLEDICKWLKAGDQSELLVKIAAEGCPGTAEWVFQNPSYLDLRHGRCRFLLLEGLPGCGKTILCSSIIQHLRRDSVGCAFYFFQRFTDEFAIESVVRQLITQLMEQAQDVPAVLVDHIDRKGDGQPSLDKLLDILQTTLALFQESYIVLDGLDKCPEWAVRKFSRIVQIALRQDTSARVLATSRFDRNVEDAIRREQLEHSTRTELQWHNNFKVNVISREVVDKDIIKMIASSKHSHHKREIGDASKGIFIWASARLQQLDEGVITDSMTSGHAEIPPSIEDLWKSLLDCIRQESGKEDWAAVADTLRLLSVSQRGLDAEEIHDYLSYDRDSSTWGRYRFSDSFGVWRRFPALLQLAGRPGKEGRPNGCTDNLGLIHPSLQELLQSDAIRRGPSGVFAIEPTKAQEEVAIRCVSYLLRYNSPNSYTSRRGWTAYAGTYWHQHVKKLGPAASEELTAHCIKLLDHRTPSFSHWTYMNRRYGDIDTSEDGDFGVQDIYPSPLYYAALLGLHQCAMKLVRDGADAHAGGGKHEYSIVAAVVAGEEEIVELLATEIATNSTLPRDAALNGAATNAAILGRPRMLQKLLELGADVSYRDKFEWTMAHWAAKNYHIDCLRTLAEFSADFDARNLTGSTPLLLASYVGSIPIMEFLLSSKVDMSFAVAAEAGQREAVDLLLANGANANAATAHRLTALCYASAQLNLPMVISLLNYGADTNWRTDFGRTPTPLHFAVTPKTAPPSEQDTPSNMIRAVVEALLSHGADPCIPDGDGRLVEEKTTDPELKEILGRYR